MSHAPVRRRGGGHRENHLFTGFGYAGVMSWIVLCLVLSGMVFLLRSLSPIASILRMLGSGGLHRQWIWLRRLIGTFLVGYALFAGLRVNATVTTVDLVVSAILASGGVFVLMVARLSYLTTSDIVRIAALEREVVRDPLTGVFNRRYLDAKLDEETSRSRRSGAPFSAILIDLDHFKHINDSYGHPVGDLVIRHVSDLLTALVRASDTVVRYGGEEFVVLAPDSNLDRTELLGERIRRNIAETGVALPDGRVLSVTASLGVATFATDEMPEQFLHRVDQALYEAKRTGRNRLCRSIGLCVPAAA